MGNSRRGRHIGMWKELTIEERKVLRKRDPSIAGFIAEVMNHGGKFFKTMSRVEQSIP
jgi:hypothetical protein